MGRGNAQPLGRAHNYGSEACSYSGLYRDKPGLLQTTTTEYRLSSVHGFTMVQGSGAVSVLLPCAISWLFTALFPHGLPTLPKSIDKPLSSSVNSSDGKGYSSALGLLPGKEDVPDEQREEERDAVSVSMLPISCVGS